MARGPAESFMSDYVGLIFLAGLIVLAVALTPIALIGVPGYIFYRLYSESPRRAERLMREETMQLYSHALSGRVALGSGEIDEALSEFWPTDMPEALRIQLLELGRASYARKLVTV